MKSRIRAVIFDMDGVLTDSEPLINAAAVAMFAEKGFQVLPTDFVPFIGMGEDRYIGGVAEKHGIALDLVEAKRRTYEIYLELVPTRLHSYPGAPELVRRCREAGLKIAVASSADRVKVRANLLQIGLPVENWHAVITGEDVGPKKPAPDIFLAAATRLETDPVECAVVEDAINGVQAAKAAGMRCVAVAQTFPAEKLGLADVVHNAIASVSLQDLTGDGSPAGAVPLELPTAPTGSATPPVISPPLPPTPPPASTGAQPPWGFWASLGLGTAIFATFTVLQAVALGVLMAIRMLSSGRATLPDIESNGLLLSLATLAGAPAMIGLSWLFARLRDSNVSHYLGFKPVGWKPLVGWALALLAFIGLSDGLTHVLGRPIVPDFMQKAYLTSGFPPLLWFALVVVAPLSEETLFRGFLFRGILHSKAGIAGAILLPALLWASIHLQYDLYGIGTIFAGGCLLAAARLQSGSLWVPLFLHSLMNFIATLEAALL